MARFKNKVLGALSATYGFIEALRAPDQVDLGGISLVHDVSRQAAMARGFSLSQGYLIYPAPIIAGAASTYKESWPVGSVILSALRKAGYTESEHDVSIYALDCVALLDGAPANLTSFHASVAKESVTPFSVGPQWPIFRCVTADTFADSAGADRNMARNILETQCFPMSLGFNDTVNLRLNTSGALTVWLYITMWAGPVGSAPWEV